MILFLVMLGAGLAGTPLHPAPGATVGAIAVGPEWKGTDLSAQEWAYGLFAMVNYRRVYVAEDLFFWSEPATNFGEEVGNTWNALESYDLDGGGWGERRLDLFGEANVLPWLRVGVALNANREITAGAYHHIHPAGIYGLADSWISAGPCVSARWTPSDRPFELSAQVAGTFGIVAFGAETWSGAAVVDPALRITGSAAWWHGAFFADLDLGMEKYANGEAARAEAKEEGAEVTPIPLSPIVRLMGGLRFW